MEHFKRVSISINMTNKCNLKCDYCIQTTRNQKEKYDINIYDSIKYIDEFQKENNYDCLSIEFFGGEPTLKRKEIIKMLEIFKQKEYFNKCIFKITTNAFIFFKEYIDFMKNNNIKNFSINISYDFAGQLKRTHSEIINNIIENNILKYKMYDVKSGYGTSNLSFSSCIVEENADKLYEYFIDAKYKFNIQFLEIVPVFPEYWEKESFKKLYNSFKKIYEYILKVEDDNLVLPTIKFPYVNTSSKHNTIKNSKNLLSFDKLEIFVLDNKKNKYYFHKDNRGILKNTTKIKRDVLDILFTRKSLDISFNNFELNLLKKYSCNKDVFDYITVSLISGFNINRYRNDIFELFEYNSFVIKKYKNIIKKIRNNIIIDIFKEFCNNGILYYIALKLGEDKTSKLIKLLKENKICINSNTHKINNYRYTITINNKERGLGKVDQHGNIELNLNRHHHCTLDAYSTLIHEIFHIYCDSINIKSIIEENELIELLCETFIQIFLNNISKINSIK